MATLCRTYPSEHVARQAIDTLRAAGVPAHDIRLLTGSRMHDVREERVGEFAGAARPGDPVGSFANVRHQRREGTGAFFGDADRQRQGTFADADREVIVTFADRSEHSHVVGGLELRRLLGGAAVDADSARRVVERLHAGHSVVLAEVADTGASEVRARLDQIAPAA